MDATGPTVPARTSPMPARSLPAAATLAAGLLFVPAFAPPAGAAPPSIHRRAVDRLTVKVPGGDTVELPGVFAGPVEAAAGGEVGKNPPGAVRFAVRRDDVDADHPGLIDRWEEAAPRTVAPEPTEAPASDDPTTIAQQLRDRLVPWLERRAGEPTLASRLEREFERVSDLLADAEEGVPPAEPAAEPAGETEPSVRRPRGPWAVLAVPRDAVVDRHRTAPHRRRLALHAWEAGLRNVAGRTVLDLRTELRRRGVEIRTAPAVPWDGIGDPAPAAAEAPFVAKLQSDDEWAARVAVVESEFLDEFSFQGTGSMLIQTPKSGRPVNGQALMMRMAGAQYGDLIDELSAPNAFSRRAQRERQANRNKTATDAAERAGRAGVRVTRVATDANAAKVTVQSEFLVRMPSGRWVPIWSAEEVRDFADADPQTAARIREDPQLKGVLEGGGGVLGGLGGGALGGLGGLLGGGGGGGLMEMAVQAGATSKAALDAVNGQWEAFRGKYLDRLDGPPLPVVP